MSRKTDAFFLSDTAKMNYTVSQKTHQL